MLVDQFLPTITTLKYSKETSIKDLIVKHLRLIQCLFFGSRVQVPYTYCNSYWHTAH